MVEMLTRSRKVLEIQKEKSKSAEKTTDLTNKFQSELHFLRKCLLRKLNDHHFLTTVC